LKESGVEGGDPLSSGRTDRVSSAREVLVRVLVTGVSGFIGREVARVFAGRGADVLALVRPPSFRVEIPGVTVVAGDLARPDSLGDLALHPAPDVVCHLAADTRMAATPEEARVNTEGTLNLVRRLGGGLRGGRFLFASSIAAVDRGRRPRGPLGEDSPPAPRSPYAVSKLECEELLRAEAAARGFTLGILRLATVYGPGQTRGGLVSLAEAVRRGSAAARLPWPGKISFCAVEDVAEVFHRLAARPDPLSGTWFVAEDRGYTMAEAAAILRGVVRAEKGPLPVPRFLLRAVSAVLWLPGVRRFAPWSLRAALSDAILCDSGPLTRLLDMRWTPLAEGLARTFG
jgi:UDP-glucose 4-epimerase